MDCQPNDIMPEECSVDDVANYLFAVDDDGVQGDFILHGEVNIAGMMGYPSRLITEKLKVYKSENETDESLYIRLEDYEKHFC